MVKISHYQIIKTLSRNRDGVFLVKDINTNQLALLKHRNIKFLKAEYDALMLCKGIGVPKVLEFNEKYEILVLEYDSKAKTLLDLQEDDIPLLTNIFPKIIANISRIHDKGLVHGDIKPSNILISQYLIKIIDFGAATRLNTNYEMLEQYEFTPKKLNRNNENVSLYINDYLALKYYMDMRFNLYKN
ncbi:MAG: RIO1 family regulatory kinase/ATPase [Succinivibrionaceae bacterium]|nr:AarF/UbiB family protein [Ruminobacter sp.]MDY5778645.1 RIO1 family regulatory kinase/ATPase [Succinivibrionaceae bacterium]MEE1340459.1 RIO1 family regulatory kinase/ATPase [Succinivibrionaceae bacterium]